MSLQALMYLCLMHLNAIIPSELPFLDVEAIVAEIVNGSINRSINTSAFKIIGIIQSNFYCNNDYMNETIRESIKKYMNEFSFISLI